MHPKISVEDIMAVFSGETYDCPFLVEFGKSMGDISQSGFLALFIVRREHYFEKYACDACEDGIAGCKIN